MELSSQIKIEVDDLNYDKKISDLNKYGHRAYVDLLLSSELDPNNAEVVTNLKKAATLSLLLFADLGSGDLK